MIICSIQKKLLSLRCQQIIKKILLFTNIMPTKEEVKKAYRNLNRLIKAVQEDKSIPEWRKMSIIDKLLDRKLEIQKWLFDYLKDEDFENEV